MTADGIQPITGQIHQFLKHMWPLVQLLTKSNNLEACNKLKKYQADVKAILMEITYNDDSNSNKIKHEFINIIGFELVLTILKVVQDILYNLASKQDVEDITCMLLILQD